MNTEAMIPVTAKTPSMLPKILPSRLAEDIPATAEEMEKKTSGTTRVNIKLMNTVPKGLTTVARSPNTRPMIAPMTTPVRMKSGKR